jgi:uncharacterized protein YxjI
MTPPSQQADAAGSGPKAPFVRYRLPRNAAAMLGTAFIRNDLGKTAFAIDCGAHAIDDVVRIRHLDTGAACLIHGEDLRSGDSITLAGSTGEVLATVTRVDLSNVRDRFSVRVDPETAWVVDGRVTTYEYSIQAGNEVVAEVSSRWFRARGSYGVQVAPAFQALLVLSVAVCLDLMVYAGGGSYA